MTPSYSAFFDELEKIAARAGLKQIGRLLSSGAPEGLAKAQTLAKTPGVLKPSVAGSQIKRLGAGAEGQATLVADPQFGVSVRKLYNPGSQIASPKMIGRKMQMASEVKSPHLAETYGFRRSDKGGRMSFHEYVQPTAKSAPSAPSAATAVGKGPATTAVTAVGKGPATSAPGTGSTPFGQMKSQLQASAADKGWHLGDIRPANVVGGKAIDVLPFRPGEMAGETAKGVSLTPSSYKSLLQLHGPKPLSEKSMYRLL